MYFLSIRFTNDVEHTHTQVTEPANLKNNIDNTDIDYTHSNVLTTSVHRGSLLAFFTLY